MFPGDLPEVTRVPIPQLKFMHIPSFRHVPDPGHLLAASCSVGGDDADGVEAVEWFPVPTAGGCAVVYVVKGRCCPQRCDPGGYGVGWVGGVEDGVTIAVGERGSGWSGDDVQESFVVQVVMSTAEVSPAQSLKWLGHRDSGRLSWPESSRHHRHFLDPNERS